MNTPDELPDDVVPVLKRHVRKQRDRLSGRTMLLYPEGAIELDPTGIAILDQCDGNRTLAAVVHALTAEFEVEESVLRSDVSQFFSALHSRGMLSLNREDVR